MSHPMPRAAAVLRFGEDAVAAAERNGPAFYRNALTKDPAALDLYRVAVAALRRLPDALSRTLYVAGLDAFTREAVAAALIAPAGLGLTDPGRSAGTRDDGSEDDG